MGFRGTPLHRLIGCCAEVGVFDTLLGTIGDLARVMEAVFDEERTTDELIDAIADLAAGLNPIVRDARRVMAAAE